MKSNDNIPKDEMLLAEAIAAARARGMKWASGFLFLDASGYSHAGWRGVPKNATACCAYGALIAAGCVPNYFNQRPSSLLNIAHGNDSDAESGWTPGAEDCGESLGWAFRCAMEEP